MKAEWAEPVRVLVVDDEASARRQVKAFLSDLAGIAVVGEARDGEEATASLTELKPHIVLLDIRMPKMDGLTVARIMRREFPDLFILFLTAYPEFEYAREAVRLGACDYVLKPVRKEELRNAVRDAARRFGERQLSDHRRWENEEMLRSLRPLLCQEYLNILISWPGAFAEREWEAQTRALGLRSLPRLVMAAQPVRSGTASTPAPGALLPQVPSLSCEGGELLRWEEGDMIVVPQPGRMIALVSPWPREPRWPEQWVKAAARWWQRRVGSELEVEAGDYCSCLAALPSSYRTAAMKLRGKAESRTGVPALGTKAELCERALRGDLVGVARLAVEIMADLPDDEAAVEARVLGGLLASAFAQVGVSHETVGKLQAEFDTLLREPWTEVRVGYRCYPRTVELLTDFVSELHRKFADSQSAGQRAVALARAFIEANYYRSLTLQEVAAYVFLSPYYFARLFKAQTGTTLGEYITEVRLLRARTLLLQTDLSVSTVSEKVGYRSCSYFSALFTKRFGTSPSVYRQTARGG